MPLVQTPTEVIQDPKQYLHLIYGEPGVGKTSWCSQIDGHYFLSTEAGTKGVSVYGENILSWQSFIEKCIELRDAKQKNFEDMRRIEAIIIDSYDALWEMAASHIMAKETFIVKGRATKFDRVEDVEYGKAYKRVNQEVVGTIRRLGLLGYGIILIGRCKEKVIKWQGQDLTGVGLAMSESVQNYVVSECDAVGWMMAEEEVKKDSSNKVIAIETGRYIYWQPTFQRIAKHRLEGFPERIENPINRGWELYSEVFRECAAKKRG